MSGSLFGAFLLALLFSHVFLPPVSAAPSREEANAAFRQGQRLIGLQDVNQYDDAIQSFTLAAQDFHALADSKNEGRSFQRIGAIYLTMTQPEKALDYFQHSLALLQQAQARGLQSGTLNYIGSLYESMGQPHRALDFFMRALRVAKRNGSKRGEAIILDNIGEIYVRLHQPQLAVEYLEQALPVWKEAKAKRGRFGFFHNIAEAYLETGQTEKALQNLQFALRLTQQSNNKEGEADNLDSIGLLYRSTGEFQKALDSFNQALPLWRQLGDLRGETSTLMNSATVLRRLRQFDQARACCEQALTKADSIFGNITRNDLKRATAQSYQWIYRDYIDFLLRQDNPNDTGRALEVSELARSRALRDLLEGNIDALPSFALAKEADTPESTLQVEDFPENILEDTLQGDQDPFQETGGAAPDNNPPSGDSPHSPGSPSAPGPESQAAAGGNSTPASAAREPISANQVPGPQPLTPDAPSATPNTRSVTPRGTASLVSVQTLAKTVRNLPPLTSTAQVEPFTRTEAALAAVDGPVVSYHLLRKELVIFLIEPSGAIHGVRAPILAHDLAEMIRAVRIEVTANDDPTQRRESLQKLYDTLIKPVETWLGNDKTGLTVVPFGPLFQVPFAALVGPDGRYLAQRFALRTTPSLTVLRFTRQRSKTLRDVPLRPVLFGDPTLPPGIPALPGASTELRGVASLFRTTGIIPRTRERATEAAFRAEAPNATEIHLATHGYVNATHPLLSGVLLAPSDGAEPPYERDGYLTVGEVFRLKLNARLITLSACDTGLGPTSADGVFGLQSAFLSAGSASLLSTLWEVDDAATSSLMQEFYRRLESDPQHNRARALKGAQLSLLQSKEFKDPLYWAGFVLTGEAS